MNIKDIKIATQLWIGLGLIMAFVLSLSLLSWQQTNQLWQQTKSLYEHPFQVTAATGRLKADIVSFRMKLRDLLLAEDEREIVAHYGEIETYRSNISREMEIVADRSLAPREDIARLQDNLAKWHAYHQQNLRLLEEGKIQEVRNRIKASNAGGITEELMASIWTLTEFANNMSEQFYTQATEKHETLSRQLAIFSLTIILLSVLVSFLLLRNMKTPLLQLTMAAEQFRRGERGARSSYASKNEFGMLSAAFNAMADSVETQMRIKERASRIADVMLREVDSRSFCRELLRELIDQTGSRSGAIYLLNPQKTDFELFASIGLADRCRGAFSAVAPEGEFGLALASKKMQRIQDIPEETRFAFATAGGSFLPREIITLPLLAGEETVAVISLASLHGYDRDTILLLESVLGVLTARMNGVLAFRQIAELAERLDQQNIELKTQQQELAAQADELSFQNAELVMQKKELDTANQLKSTFLSNMSHELRTPLNSVIALSSVLGRRLKAKISDEELGYLEVIERNGKSLLTLINGILDLSRIESGREEVISSRFSLQELVGEILGMMDPLVREKGISLINRVGSGLPPINSDETKVRHILQNLIANAVKFTEKGSVSISAHMDGEEKVRILISDTGIGIAPEHLEHIFEEFRQADEGTSRKYGGTGLGLAISKKFARLLQGDIEVKSTVGQGSIFTFILPLLISSPDAEVDGAAAFVGRRGRNASPPRAVAGNGECILVVEDSEPAAIQLIDILSEQGYRVQVAQNGREALVKIAEYPPAAVILDLMMPEVDGFEVLRQIRSSEKTPLLPVLILTAKHVSKEELSFLTGNHIHQLIRKGDIGKDELLAAVAEMIPQRMTCEQVEPSSLVVSDDAAIMAANGDLPLILVVEDNPDNLLTVLAILENKYRIETAENGLEALSQARRHLPDLILMDLALPLMDGFTTLEEIRKDEDLAGIPVLALTASAMTGDRESILARGFDGYISKPIEEMEFRKILQQVLYARKIVEDSRN